MPTLQLVFTNEHFMSAAAKKTHHNILYLPIIYTTYLQSKKIYTLPWATISFCNAFDFSINARIACKQQNVSLDLISQKLQ